ncbi:MAG: carbon monoxide dehydrogenase [Acetatifactor sp.]|nr:carbon monoxide dehydrogenase [Acetatifactor sp.]MDE7352688.1 carbon monoxide dehydrogenase [Acetatifactor sp.]
MIRMKLYDQVIEKILAVLGAREGLRLPVGETHWPEVSDRSMILRSDMAYELGGEGLPAIGCTVITADERLVPEDGITLLGRDLPRIQEDVPYGRIALVQVDGEALGEGQALYQAVRALEYTRYHFYPKGFMLRISAARHRESVRVGKEALAEGLDFTITGNRMISAFHKNASVKAVHIYYVTLEEKAPRQSARGGSGQAGVLAPGFDYKALAECAGEAEDITRTIDHIMTGGIMDCVSCGLQRVCDEVEGLRELHFQK